MGDSQRTLWGCPQKLLCLLTLSGLHRNVYGRTSHPPAQHLAPFPGLVLAWGSQLFPHFGHWKEPMCPRGIRCFSSSACQQPSFGLSCFLGKHRTYRGYQSLPSARPLGRYKCPAVPGLRVQLRGATAPGGYRHGHSGGTDLSCRPLTGHRRRKTAFTGLWWRRPGSSLLASPSPPLCALWEM